jgi:hypothetical protein
MAEPAPREVSPLQGFGLLTDSSIKELETWATAINWLLDRERNRGTPDAATVSSGSGETHRFITEEDGALVYYDIGPDGATYAGAV